MIISVFTDDKANSFLFLFRVTIPPNNHLIFLQVEFSPLSDILACGTLHFSVSGVEFELLYVVLVGLDADFAYCC